MTGIDIPAGSSARHRDRVASVGIDGRSRMSSKVRRHGPGRFRAGSPALVPSDRVAGRRLASVLPGVRPLNGTRGGRRQAREAGPP